MRDYTRTQENHMVRMSIGYGAALRELKKWAYISALLTVTPRYGRMLIPAVIGF